MRARGGGRGDNDLGGRLQRLVLGALVELVPADVGRPRQDAVDLADAPAPAVAGEDATLVEIGRDVLDAHRAGRAVAFEGHITMEVSITPDHMSQRHWFQFEIDQSYLPPLVKQCQSILEAYPIKGSRDR